MKGMTIKEFMEKVWYGDEIEFMIGEMTYFVQGYMEENKYILVVDYWIKADGTEPPHDYLLKLICNTVDERLEKFKEAKIFNGKTIYEVEDEVDVIWG